MEIAPGAAAVRVGRVLREPQGGPRLSGQGGVLAETDVIRAGAVSPLITCIMYACVNTGGKYLLSVAMTSLVHATAAFYLGYCNCSQTGVQSLLLA